MASYINSKCNLTLGYRYEITEMGNSRNEICKIMKRENSNITKRVMMCEVIEGINGLANGCKMISEERESYTECQ